MSYILDALKKMDHEKTRGAAPGGMTNLSGDLFRESRHPSMGNSIWKPALLALLASSVAVAATSFFFTHYRQTTHPGSGAPAPALAERSIPTRPVPPPPAAANVAAKAEAQAPVPPPAFRFQKSGEAGQQAAGLSGNPDSRETGGRGRSGAGAARQGEAERAVPVAQVAPAADIRVSGIAWQDERRARRAVVNGLLLREGNVVAGARIREIMRDRVRFSRAGGYFDVAMTAAGTTAAMESPAAPKPAAEDD